MTHKTVKFPALGIELLAEELTKLAATPSGRWRSFRVVVLVDPGRSAAGESPLSESLAPGSCFDVWNDFVIFHDPGQGAERWRRSTSVALETDLSLAFDLLSASREAESSPCEAR